MTFVGRVQEKANLHKFLADKFSMATLVYGRRRVGKSELIKQAVNYSATSCRASCFIHYCSTAPQR